MTRLPRVRFSVIEIPPETPSDRGLPPAPRELSASEDPLLARLLVQCARKALSSGPAEGLNGEPPRRDNDESDELTRFERHSRFRIPMRTLRGEAPPPLGETMPSLDQPARHQRWPRRDDAPRNPR